MPGTYVTVFSDDFESYVSGDTPLDKNYAGGGNEAPNGSGNAWFGPNPPNAYVVGAETGVTPHSGTNELTGDGIPYDGDENWYNLAYRLRGGQVFKGNCMLDWWFYDRPALGTPPSRITSLWRITIRLRAIRTTQSSWYDGVTQVQRLSLGASINQ